MKRKKNDQFKSAKIAIMMITVCFFVFLAFILLPINWDVDPTLLFAMYMFSLLVGLMLYSWIGTLIDYLSGKNVTLVRSNFAGMIASSNLPAIIKIILFATSNLPFGEKLRVIQSFAWMLFLIMMVALIVVGFAKEAYGNQI